MQFMSQARECCKSIPKKKKKAREGIEKWIEIPHRKGKGFYTFEKRLNLTVKEMQTETPGNL